MHALKRKTGKKRGKCYEKVIGNSDCLYNDGSYAGRLWKQHQDSTNTSAAQNPQHRNSTAEAAESSAAETGEAADAQTDSDKVYQIGICQLLQHDALDAATLGFKEALTDKLGEDKVKFDEQNASGDSATCATIINQFVSADVDLILANATASLQAAAAGTGTIPILGTSITDYATALEIDDWNRNHRQKHFRNIRSGTSQGNRPQCLMSFSRMPRQ